MKRLLMILSSSNDSWRRHGILSTDRH